MAEPTANRHGISGNLSNLLSAIFSSGGMNAGLDARDFVEGGITPRLPSKYTDPVADLRLDVSCADGGKGDGGQVEPGKTVPAPEPSKWDDPVPAQPAPEPPDRF